MTTLEGVISQLNNHGVQCSFCCCALPEDGSCAGLVLRIFLLLLPFILRFMTMLEGVISQLNNHGVQCSFCCCALPEDGSCAGLVLRIFLLLLPFILRFMTMLEGVISTAVLDARVSTKYFIFQVSCAVQQDAPCVTAATVVDFRLQHTADTAAT